MFLKLLLQGLDSNLSGYEAVLALYEHEAGKKPEKVCHLIFLEHVLFRKIWKKDIEEIIKRVLTSFSLVGHCSAHC